MKVWQGTCVKVPCCVPLCCSLISALSVYKDHSCLLPAGDCACQSEDLHSPRAEVRDRLPGDCHRSVSQQRGRVCVCQTTNQWVRSWECKSKKRERPHTAHYMLSFPLYQGLCRGCPAYVWSKQASSLYLWAGIGPHLLCKATDSPSDHEVGHTHGSICCRWRQIYLVTLNDLGRWKDYC